MFSKRNAVLALACVSAVWAAPIRREVPQEHSHEPILASVQTSLQLNNPDNIQDSVFGLLGDAAAAAGQGDIADTDCLQQATADQAFTNAKAAGDVDGMTNALIYRALERNTGSVGLASVACTSIQAVNPEIAALQQHQDPASDGAAAINKQITLTLAQQIASIGGDPQDALKSGTFAPGDPNDATGKGNTCDDANDAAGCIFSQNLLVDDASAEEIDAAAAGGAGAANATAASGAANATAADAAGASNATATDSVSAASSTAADSADAAVSTSSVQSGKSAKANAGSVAAGAAAKSAKEAKRAAAASGAAADASSADAAAATSTAAAASSAGNLQTFTGDLGGLPPAVTAGGKGFEVAGSDSFLNEGAALQRSCAIQHNACADQANSGGGSSVADCDAQETQCNAAATA